MLSATPLSYLIITDLAGKTTQCEIVFMRHIVAGTVDMHITAEMRLDRPGYDAVYVSDAGSVDGFYVVVNAELFTSGGWYIEGLFQQRR
jgi:hypothetical protein